MPTWGYERAVNDVKRARTPTHRSWLGLCRRICCDGFMTVQVQKRSDPQGVRRLLEALPSWFGIPDAIDGYVAAGDTMPSYLAVQDDRTLGAVSYTHLDVYKRQSPSMNGLGRRVQPFGGSR